ncbi:MAG TPA: hypothetical protein VJR26_05430 [Candidatus Acidoferrales bacterium]|nr:hypothetical protein [Candidatus Acidoferrales bacterium]
MFRLDYISCVLTIVSTVLVGKKLWHGWIVAAINSLVVCWIGIRTAQFGFVPANIFCIGLYANNLSQWRPKDRREVPSADGIEPLKLKNHPPGRLFSNRT